MGLNWKKRWKQFIKKNRLKKSLSHPKGTKRFDNSVLCKIKVRGKYVESAPFSNRDTPTTLLSLTFYIKINGKKMPFKCRYNQYWSEVSPFLNYINFPQDYRQDEIGCYVEMVLLEFCTLYLEELKRKPASLFQSGIIFEKNKWDLRS